MVLPRPKQARVTQTALILAGSLSGLAFDHVSSRAPLSIGYRHERFACTRGRWPGRCEKSARHSSEAHSQPGLGSGVADRTAVAPICHRTRRFRGARGHDSYLKQAPAGRHCWLPLLVSWDPKRTPQAGPLAGSLRIGEVAERFPLIERSLSRVSWGRDETYVIYRSLAKPAPRAFSAIRHGSVARGPYSRHDGAVEPILMVD